MSDLRALSAMHYWPASNEGLPPIACGAEGGFRSSDRSKVTCPACRRAVGPLDDRRQQVREAYYDNGGAPDARGEYAPIEMAITTATTVKMTHDIVRAFIEAPDDPEEITGPLIAAFRAAGFEVVE